MRFHEILDFHEYMEETGKMMNVPKEFCGNNKYAGNKVYYDGKWHLVLNSTQNKLELASINNDLTSIGWIKRKYCKIKDYKLKSKEDLEKILWNKWRKPVVIIVEKDSFHGDRFYNIYANDELQYIIFID